MKKQSFSIIATVSGAVAALLFCLMWAGYGVSGTVIAAPPDVTSTARTFSDSSPVSPGEVRPAGLRPRTSNAAEGWVIECADCPKQFSSMTDRSLRLDTMGRPHIAYGGDHLYYAWYDGANWRYETVDGATNVGKYASLDLDGNGYPHISYYDDLNGDLKYAYQDAIGWHIETIDSSGDVGRYTSLTLDSSGYPHISYYYGDPNLIYSGSNDLKYAYQDATGWHIETVDSAGGVGRFTSLVLDASDYPHISYHDESNDAVKYAYQDSGGWHFQIIDSKLYSTAGWYTSLTLDGDGYPHISYFYSNDLKYAYQDATGWYSQTIDSTGWVGKSSSLALDGNGYPHISYYDQSNGNLKYAYQDATDWHIQTIDSEGYVGMDTSLALDNDGYPHISYQGSLKYVYQDIAGWHIQTADIAEYAGSYTSLTLDGAGYPHVSYKGSGLKYAYRDATTWYTQTVEGEGSIEYTSLALDGDEYPHISYFYHSASGVAYEDLRYAYLDATGWHTETVDNGLVVGEYNSLALDGDGYPHISYYDSFAYDLKYAYQDIGGWHIQTIDNGGRHTSLVLDGDGYPHISYRIGSGSSSNLKYAYQNATGWHTPTVDSTDGVGSYTSLALDADGYPHISYYDSDNKDLKYAYQDATGWYSQTIDSGGWVGEYTSLALDGDGYPHISYYDDLNEDLKYAYQDTSGWHIQTIVSEGEVGEYTSLMLDGDGKAHISYHNATNDDLKYAFHSAQLAADFTASPTAGTRPLTVVFTDTSTDGEVDTWLWSFGDTATSTLQNPTHTYTTAGAYTVTLAVSGPGGSDAVTRANYITVYDPVEASFTASPVRGASPLTVDFTDTSSGPAAVWSWNFGDGAVSARQHPTHTYTTTGVYTVSLTAQAAGASAMLPGGMDTLTRAHYITVTESPPQVDFIGHPRSGDVPLTVQFTSTVTGAVTAYQWNFGNGGTANTPNPTNTYENAGSFGVTLAVTGSGGTASVSKQGYITVNASPGAPTATFSADVVSGIAPLTVTFTAFTSGTVEHWLWNFGDGDTAFTGPVVNHTYVTSNTFDVSLTVSNTHGSFIVSKPGYIVIRTKDDESHFIYLPLILRNAL